jgi:hypothetical protein
MPGAAPGTSLTFFAPPKKVSKERRPRYAALRVPGAATAGRAGKKTRCAQTVFARQPPAVRCGAGCAEGVLCLLGFAIVLHEQRPAARAGLNCCKCSKRLDYLHRHPGEGRGPRLQRLAAAFVNAGRWIPAFAGMTAFFFVIRFFFSVALLLPGLYYGGGAVSFVETTGGGVGVLAKAGIHRPVTARAACKCGSLGPRPSPG